MYFALSPEQSQMQREITRFLDDSCKSRPVRTFLTSDTAYDSRRRKMAIELGLQGIHIPERYGGSGATYVELALVLEALGASLSCVPYFSTVALAANLLLQSSDESAKIAYLPKIASGDVVATFAFAEDAGRWDLGGVTLGADATQGEWRLNGHKAYVIDGASADLIFVAARTDSGLAVFAVQGEAAGLVRSPIPTLDQTRKMARLEFHDTAAQLLGDSSGADDWISKTLAMAAIALSAEQVGGARRCLSTAVEYAKSRVQFGRPIGAFQAIKHKCANILLDVEPAQAATYYAAWAVNVPGEDVLLLASLAQAYASDTYMIAASENMQIHGGMGFTSECDAQLFFKRAKSSSLLLGSAAYHRELMAQRMGL